MDSTRPSLPAELEPVLARSHLGATPLDWIEGESMPPPYGGLLVHQRDMTSALERHHGDAITLDVLQVREFHGTYLREVTLHAARSGAIVEYGLIAILLEAFPEALHGPIRAGATPLGAILNRSGLAYHSRPQGYFSLPAKALATLIPSSGGEILYGRYNHLIRSDDDRCLARILEILPTT